MSKKRKSEIRRKGRERDYIVARDYRLMGNRPLNPLNHPTILHSLWICVWSSFTFKASIFFSSSSNHGCLSVNAPILLHYLHLNVSSYGICVHGSVCVCLLCLSHLSQSVYVLLSLLSSTLPAFSVLSVSLLCFAFAHSLLLLQFLSYYHSTFHFLLNPKWTQGNGERLNYICSVAQYSYWS